jgi:hypothetical protein
MACFRAEDFYLGTDTTVWVGSEYLTKDAPTSATETLTISGAVSVDDTSITVAAGITNPLYEGYPIRFANGSVVVVSADVAAAETNIPIEAAKSAIPDTTTATIIPVVPYFSAATVDFGTDGESIEIRNLGACDWATNLMTKRTGSLSLSGSEVIDDPALALIRAASRSLTDRAYILIVDPSGLGTSGAFWVKSFSSPKEVDTDVKVSFELVLDGDPTETDLAAQ